MSESISWSEAFTRVGRAKYGSEWIGRLTEREQYLIDEYCVVTVSEARSSILPGHASYLADGKSVWFKRSPLGATLQDEVGCADDRRRWKVVQDEYVMKWLADNGFSYPRVNLSDLESKLITQFSVSGTGGTENRTRTGTAKSKPAKKSDKDKENEALEIAKTFVVDGVAPNLKTHTTSVMGVLKALSPEDRMLRKDAEALLKTAFAAARRAQGNPRSKRLR
jgi:hypothetical protein